MANSLKFQHKPDINPDNYFFGLIIVVLFSFIFGLFAYEPISHIKINFFIFEDLALSRIVGDWKNITKYCLSVLFCTISGFSYHVIMKFFKLPVTFCVPISILVSMASMIFLSIVIIITVTILAMVVGLLALFFFNPGDR
jgi:hypothetical protein